jgi:predicted Fe-S protein YdhL (DUF1289 family)
VAQTNFSRTIQTWSNMNETARSELLSTISFSDSSDKDLSTPDAIPTLAKKEFRQLDEHIQATLKEDLLVKSYAIQAWKKLSKKDREEVLLVIIATSRRTEYLLRCNVHKLYAQSAGKTFTDLNPVLQEILIGLVEKKGFKKLFTRYQGSTPL